MKHLFIPLSFFICSTVYAERYLCMCCDDNRQVVEMIIESCEETKKNRYPKLNDSITYTDLLISGIVIASIPYNSLNDSNPKKVKREVAGIKTYIYEERDGTTCKAFEKGNKVLMLTSKLMCGENIEGDLACMNQGNVATFLPEKYSKLNKENVTSKGRKTQ